MSSLTEQPVCRFAIVLLVCVVFLWLRCDNWPRIYFADELIPLAVVEHMVESGTLDTNWDNADWSGNYAGGVYNLEQYNFSSYHVTLRALKALVNPWQGELPDVVLYRYFSVLFQAMALLLVMDLVRRFAGWPLAGFAGLFVAVMPQSVIDAHYLRPETFVTLLVAAGLWLGWRSCQVKTAAWPDAVSALVWGVAFACKISLLPMAIAAWCFLLWRRQPVATLVIWWVLFASGFAVSAPYAFADPVGFLGGAGILFSQYSPAITGNPEPLFASAGKLLAYLWAFFGGLTWMLLLVATRTCKQPVRRLVLACVWATVFYSILFAYQKVFFERNLSHLIPLWAVLVASGADQLWRWMSSRFPSQSQRVVCLTLLVLVLSGVMAERAHLSHGIVATFFGGSPVVADQVSTFEAALLEKQQRTQIERMVPMLDYQHMDRFSSNAVLQVPHYKLPDQKRLDDLLQNSGWIAVARLDLPYGFLPYNQLQISHAPVAYDYYIRRETDKVSR